MLNFTLSKERTALLVVDVQDKIFAVVDHSNDVLQTILRVIKSFQVLNLPIFVTEQYPKGLGPTVLPVRNALGPDYIPWTKTTFSCLDDPDCLKSIEQLPAVQWVLVGVEAHVCVLQTAKSLLKLGKQVTILNDAISSRSVYDFSTSIAEMRDAGVRISCSETILFELLRDSSSDSFKEISQLIRSRCDN